MISIPSSPIRVFDAPEVRSIVASFQYGFFVSDERISERGFREISGALPEAFTRNGSPDFSFINAVIPRAVKMSFEYNDPNNILAGQRVSADLTTSREELESAIKDGKVTCETNMASRLFNSYTFSNIELDSEINNVMRQALNPVFESNPDGATPSSVVDEVSNKTTVDARLLGALVPPDMNDVLGAAEAPHKTVTQQEPGLARVISNVQLNNAFAPMILRKAVERGTSLLNGLVNSTYLKSVATVNESDSLRENIGKVPGVDPSDMTFSSKYFRELRPVNDYFAPEAATVGILVEKTRIFRGKRYRLPPIVMADSNPTLIFDTKVAYGQTYEYTARTLNLYRIFVTDPAGNAYEATYLVASRPSPATQVVAEEKRAPLPPPDVQYYYDHDNNALSIAWDSPSNPQRDIKYFQIFRRKSLDEPFELIRMIDFDDSVVRSKYNERIDPSLISAYPYPVLHYVDPEFGRESKFIYAVVSVDARMQSSPYSAQTMVSFNQNKNRIELELAAFIGAPKQYPNWTKKAAFFVDSMKDSGHSKVKIYFDPEVYSFIDEAGTREPLFLGDSEDDMAKYVFQFINTDRLAEQRFEVKIENAAYNQKAAAEEPEDVPALPGDFDRSLAAAQEALRDIAVQVNIPAGALGGDGEF